MTEPAEPKQARKGWQHATPIAMLAVYAVGPAILIPALGSHAVGGVIVLIFAIAAIAGLIDGLTFRPTWSLPILAGVGFEIAKLLYFNDGTFIYALGTAATAGAAMAIGAALRTESSIREARV